MISFGRQNYVHTRGDCPPEEETTFQNLLVMLKRYVSTYKIIQQHA